MGMQHDTAVQQRRGPFARVKRMLGYPEFDYINEYVRPEMLVAGMPLPPGRSSCLYQFLIFNDDSILRSSHLMTQLKLKMINNLL